MRAHPWKILCAGAALAWAGAAAGQTPTGAVEPLSWERFSLIYSPEVALSNSSLGQALQQAAQGDGVHNIGFETSTQTGSSCATWK
jgi:hypothetical protein